MTYAELYAAFLNWMCDTQLRIHVNGRAIDTTAGKAVEYYGSCEVACFDDYEVELKKD